MSVSPVPTRPLRSDAERNRQRILKAAAEVFAVRGLDAGLDEIARHAGVGTGTIYRRFPDKASLIDALFGESVAAITAVTEQAAAMTNPWKGLVHLLEGVLEVQVNNRAMHELMSSGKHRHDRLIEARDRMRPLLVALVERAQLDGQLRADVTPADISVIPLMLDALGRFGQHVDPQVWRRYLGLLVDGLRTSRRSPTALPVAPITMAQFDAALQQDLATGHK